MALDLEATARQMLRLRADLLAQGEGLQERLREAVERLASLDPAEVNEKARRAEGRIAYLPAGLVEPPGLHRPASPVPGPYSALAVDGSHIDVDRHLPVRCYLLNLGTCLLVYGEGADARLESLPFLACREEDLFLRDPSTGSEVPVEGPVLGLRRTVAEVAHLARRAGEWPPPDRPLLALLDGSLILWALAGGAENAYPAFLRRALLQEGLLPALDALQALAERLPLALCAYISAPRSTEVVNALRLALCPHEPPGCRPWAPRENGRCPCLVAEGLTDRALFSALLGEGERSALFFTRSSVVREYGAHSVFFFYLNTGLEVARVEVPEWTARDPDALDRAHTLVLDQVRRGRGYPLALQEAHEQAVLTQADRATFRAMVLDLLEGAGRPALTSQKDRSKRTRWL